MNMDILIWLGNVFAAVLAWLNLPTAFWQYLFFLRVPLISGLLLIALPFIATKWLRAMLRNLFVLRGRWQISVSITSAVMTGLTVVLIANAIVTNAPARFEVETWITISEIWQYVLAIFLGLPICVAVAILAEEQSVSVSGTPSTKVSAQDRWIGVGIGSIFSIGLLFLVSWLRYWLFSQESLKQVLIKGITFLSKGNTDGYVVPSDGPFQTDLARGHLTALAIFVIELLIYLFIAYKFKPEPKSSREEAPALLYVMILMASATLFLGNMTFFFDDYRILPLLLLLLGSVASYSIFKVDHFFKLYPLKTKATSSSELPNEDFALALSNRLQHQGKDKTLVIVCASGGGIQAAGWTAQVLIGLQEVVGDSFAKAIGLISAVSGGSVGTLYYLDRINLQSHIPALGDSTVFVSATRDSLDAVGWGLAYPDLWRAIGLPFLVNNAFVNPFCDRGQAIETDWQGEMKDPEKTTWISQWRTQALQGEIPIPVFNSTIVDTGDRFLISPMSFYQFLTNASSGTSSKDYKFQDFNQLYGNYDMSVVTAARLSATFPYVSPVCRPCVVGEDAKAVPIENLTNYHFADGGYFDNSGSFTALEWLNQFLGSKQDPGIKRVMIVQINPFPKNTASFQARADKNQGWIMGVIGPVLALFKVRDSTQISRSQVELALLQERWKKNPAHPVEIENYSIYFPNSKQMKQIEEQFPDAAKRGDDFTFFFNDQGKYEPPLSWKLTEAEKKAIQDAWKWIAQHQENEVQKIKKKWQEWENED